MRVLLVDDDKALCNLIAEYFEYQDDIDLVDCVYDGRQVLPTYYRTNPDIIVLDLVLPGHDGMQIIEHFAGEQVNSPRIIVLSAFGCERLVARASSLGVDYYLMKPFSLKVLTERCRQVHNGELTGNDSISDGRQLERIQERTAHYLSIIGVPPHYKGYRYLSDAISLGVRDSFWLEGITKKLYPAIGKKHNTSAAQVERTIRHAIEVTWERGNITQLNLLFPTHVDAEKGKLTNLAFISQMVNIIRRDLGPV